VHFLHMAVRTAALNCMPAALLKQSQVRFVIYTLKLLDQWAPIYITPAWQLPLNLARDHGPNITAAFELAGMLTKENGTHTLDLISAVLSMDVEGVRWLLDAVGQPPSKTWQQVCVCFILHAFLMSPRLDLFMFSACHEHTSTAQASAAHMCLYYLGSLTFTELLQKTVILLTIVIWL